VETNEIKIRRMNIKGFSANTKPSVLQNFPPPALPGAGYMGMFSDFLLTTPSMKCFTIEEQLLCQHKESKDKNLIR
jgi:hypothetical protein